MHKTLNLNPKAFDPQRNAQQDRMFAKGMNSGMAVAFKTLNPKPWTLNLELQTLNSGPWTLNHKP